MKADVTQNRFTKCAPRGGAAGRLLLALLACCTLAACGGERSTPEEEVRAWVWQGHELAESKDRRALVDMIAPTYADARGNSRDDIENMFRAVFLRQKKVALITRIDAVQVHADTAAEVTLDVGMAGTDDNVLGFSADAYQFEMELEKDGDDWLLISARWGQVGRELR